MTEKTAQKEPGKKPAPSKKPKPQQEVVVQIPLSELHPFPDHPFQVREDASMQETAESVKEYVGIAADEAWRCKDERYPLVEWGITEAQALQACYDRGFDFGGLYEIYHRASCWCCPFQRIDELRKLRKHHPELWEKLLELDRRALAQFGTGPLGQFKQNWSVKRLDTRFAEEDGQTG